MISARLSMKCSRQRRCRKDAPVIAAGIGAAQVETFAAGIGRPCTTFGVLANAAPECAEWATRCAPAVAVALLMQAA